MSLTASGCQEQEGIELTTGGGTRTVIKVVVVVVAGKSGID